MRETILTVYHGSIKTIRKPDPHFGNPKNDYGAGFYLTESKEKAEQWSLLNSNGENGISNRYELDTAGLTVLDMQNYGTLTWIAEILKNRGSKDLWNNEIASRLIKKYGINTGGSDIVKGYRADDNTMDMLDMFINGHFSVEELETVFKKADLGIQICLKSEKAFSQLTFTGSKTVEFDKNLLTPIFNAKRFAVNKINARIRQELDEGYRVTGITGKTAAMEHLEYVNGYYTVSPKRADRNKQRHITETAITKQPKEDSYAEYQERI